MPRETGCELKPRRKRDEYEACGSALPNRPPLRLLRCRRRRQWPSRRRRADRALDDRQVAGAHHTLGSRKTRNHRRPFSTSHALLTSHPHPFPAIHLFGSPRRPRARQAFQENASAKKAVNANISRQVVEERGIEDLFENHGAVPEFEVNSEGNKLPKREEEKT